MAGNPSYRRYERLARRLGIADRVRFVGHCPEMRNAYFAAGKLDVLAATTVPTLVLLLVGGAVADRVRRRTVLIVTNLATAVVMAVLAAVLITVWTGAEYVVQALKVRSEGLRLRAQDVSNQDNAGQDGRNQDSLDQDNTGQEGQL